MIKVTLNNAVMLALLVMCYLFAHSSVLLPQRSNVQECDAREDESTSLSRERKKIKLVYGFAKTLSVTVAALLNEILPPPMPKSFRLIVKLPSKR